MVMDTIKRPFGRAHNTFDEFHTAFTSPLPAETRVSMQTYYLGKGCRLAEVTGAV